MTKGADLPLMNQEVCQDASVVRVWLPSLGGLASLALFTADCATEF